MYCNKCGNKLNGNEQFCGQCGSKIITKPHLSYKWLVLLGLGTTLIILIIILVNQFKDDNLSKQSNQQEEEIITPSLVTSNITYNYSNTIIKFLNGEYSNKNVTSAEEALNTLYDIKDKLKFQNLDEEFTLEKEESNNNIDYYKFKQVYKDIPVLNQNIIIAAKQGKVIGFSGYYIPNINIDTTPQLSIDEITSQVLNNFGDNIQITNIDLAIWNDYDTNELVYQVIIIENNTIQELLINANSGECISQTDLLDSIYEYTGTGIDNYNYKINLQEYNDTIENKVKYHFYDSTRNIIIKDFRNIGLTPSLFLGALHLVPIYSVNIENEKIVSNDNNYVENAVTTMAQYEKIYDYYKNILGRDSYDNKGSSITVNLGVSKSTFKNEDLDNAAWMYGINQMFIGNTNGKSYSASLDVLAHEFTHGVASYISNFASTAKRSDKNKAFEAGALNEAYADILGSLIEGKNWTIAENNETLRSAINPENYNAPSIKGEKYYYPDGFLKDGTTLEELLARNNLKYVTDYDKGGVHDNSNVVFHAAYLMYEDNAFKTREEMAKVWYNSLFLLSSYSTFEDCALAVIKSATNLGLDVESISKITKAFIKTNMLESNDYVLNGVITSDNDVLENVTIEIFSTEDNKLITSTKSDKLGKYEITLKTGNYKIKVSKEGYKEQNNIIIINGETTYDITLDKIQNSNSTNLKCSADKCYKLTVYFMDSIGDKLEENYETYMVPAGAKFDSKIFVEELNKALGEQILTTNGESFFIKVGGYKMELAWYYKGTSEKFKWDTPITKDIAIEMKMLNGMIDSNTLQDIQDLFG